MTPEDTEGPAGDGADGTSSNTPTTRVLDIATAPRADSARWPAGTTTWPDFVLTLSEPADHKECGGIVFGRLKFGRRNRASVVSRSAVTLDVDYAAAGLIERVRELGYRVAWHSTWRHTAEEPRYRLIFPTARPLTGDEYIATANALMDRIGRDEFDQSTDQPERFMWRPSRKPGGDYVHGSQDGELLPVLVGTAPERAETDRTPLDLDALVRDGVPEGEQRQKLLAAVLKMRGQNVDEEHARKVFCQIVEASDQDSSWPWTDAHFDEFWSSADNRVSAEVAVTFESVAAAPRERPALALVSLADFLTEPHDPTQYRLDGLLPVGGRAVLAAQFKAGKTTLRDNLVRSLADEVPFLGEFAVAPLAAGRTIVVLDNEMNRGQMREWLRDQSIVNVDRVFVLLLRGRVREFNLLDPEVRARWAAMLREANAGFIVFDCLRAVLDALGLDESHDSGTFFVAFDALLDEAGAGEALVVHHMGHSNDRARGDSRIRDWPDVEWRLMRKGRPGADPDPADPRYFSAYGRDVDVPERGVDFDRTTRHLTLNGGNRHSVAASAALADVIQVVTVEGAPMTKTEIEQALKGDHPQKAIRDAVDLGLKDGRLTSQEGARRAILINLSVSPS